MDSQEIGAAIGLIELINNLNNQVYKSRSSSAQLRSKSDSKSSTNDLSKNNECDCCTTICSLDQPHHNLNHVPVDRLNVSSSSSIDSSNTSRDSECDNVSLSKNKVENRVRCEQMKNSKRSIDISFNNALLNSTSNVWKNNSHHNENRRRSTNHFDERVWSLAMKCDPQSKPQLINYSDNDSSSENNCDLDVSLEDACFETHYSEQNLYQTNDQEYFDNKKYRIFVVRYGNNIRVFKPSCIVRETSSLLCKIIGTYCVDAHKLTANHRLPRDFIWPLDANKHTENVRAIRQLIKDHPVDDRLPYVDVNENAIKVKPFSLQDENDMLDLDELDEKGDENTDLTKRNFKNKFTASEKMERKMKSTDFMARGVMIDQHTNYEGVMCDTRKRAKIDDIRQLQETKANRISESMKRKLKKNRHSVTGVAKVKPAHCPYCYRLFSANFNSKLHYHGRFKVGFGLHISCKVASKIKGEKNLEPILCVKNCEICVKLELKSKQEGD